MASVNGVLLDLGGVVYVGDEALPGALEALSRLKASGLRLRYITNTTRQPLPALIAKLARIGVEAEEGEIFAPARAARAYLKAQGLTPHLLVHPRLECEFAGIEGDRGAALVVGDAGEGFTYAALNAAFRVLNEGAPFLALARNRSFRDADGELSLDAGPFVAALEYASGRAATVLGKPSRDFFHAAVDSMGCTAETVAMIGDDAEADVAGAMAAGLQGVLVRTGKYVPGAEAALERPPTHLADDLAGAVDWLLTEQAHERPAFLRSAAVTGCRLNRSSRNSVADFMKTERLTLEELDALCRRCLAGAGCDEANAAAIAGVIAAAERDHCHAHGLLRVPGYVRSLASGKSNGRADPSHERIAPGVLRMDGDNGFTPLAHQRGCAPLASLAKEQGIAALAIVNTHHFAALWPEIEMLAMDGVCAFACTSAFPIVSPPGGSRPLFGTNPIAFGWPRGDEPPVVFDMATAAMAHGEVLVAEREGRQLPEGVIVDKQGRPSTDPSDVHEGSILAFGGVKGALVSMMVELLAGALMGEPFSFEVGRANAPDGSANRGGELIVAMDPGRFGDAEGWQGHAEAFFAEMRAQEGVRLAGARRFEARADSEKNGVDLPADLLAEVRGLAGD